MVSLGQVGVRPRSRAVGSGWVIPGQVGVQGSGVVVGVQGSGVSLGQFGVRTGSRAVRSGSREVGSG